MSRKDESEAPVEQPEAAPVSEVSLTPAEQSELAVLQAKYDTAILRVAELQDEVARLKAEPILSEQQKADVATMAAFRKALATHG